MAVQVKGLARSLKILMKINIPMEILVRSLESLEA